MVFEDNLQIRGMMVAYLEARGYDVYDYAEPLHCPVYAEGACACSDGQCCCDILITDIEMPRTSGLDMVERMQNNGCKTAPARVLIMSAGWDSEKLDRAERLGCSVLHKPFRLDALGHWLDDCEARSPATGSYRSLPGTQDPDDSLDDSNSAGSSLHKS